jgi:hypothetical protein
MPGASWLPLMFETAADASAEGGAGEPEPEALGGDEPDYGPDPDAGGEPDYGQMLQSPEGQQALQQAVMEAMQGFQPEQGYGEPEYGYEQEDPYGMFDPLSPDAPQQLAQMFQAQEQRLLQAIQSMPGVGYAAEQQQTSWANDTFDTIESQVIKGKLPQELREISIAMAAGSRPPDNDPAAAYFRPDQALTESARGLHALIQRERQQAVQDYINGVAGEPTAGASEPSGSGPGAVRTEAEPTNMREARERWERREGLRD